MFTNVMPLVLGAIASMAIGIVWYSPMLFGTQWMKLMGMKKKDMQLDTAKMAPIFVATFLAALLMAYVLGSLMLVLDVTNSMLGMQLGFMVWLGFVATTSLVNSLYSNRSLKLYLLDNGYHLITLMVMGYLYGMFPR